MLALLQSTASNKSLLFIILYVFHFISIIKIYVAVLLTIHEKCIVWTTENWNESTKTGTIFIVYFLYILFFVKMRGGGFVSSLLADITQFLLCQESNDIKFKLHSENCTVSKIRIWSFSLIVVLRFKFINIEAHH